MAAATVVGLCLVSLLVNAFSDLLKLSALETNTVQQIRWAGIYSQHREQAARLLQAAFKLHMVRKNMRGSWCQAFHLNYKRRLYLLNINLNNFSALKKEEAHRRTKRSEMQLFQQIMVQHFDIQLDHLTKSVAMDGRKLKDSISSVNRKIDQLLLASGIPLQPTTTVDDQELAPPMATSAGAAAVTIEQGLGQGQGGVGHSANGGVRTSFQRPPSTTLPGQLSSQLKKKNNGGVPVNQRLSVNQGGGGRRDSSSETGNGLADQSQRRSQPGRGIVEMTDLDDCYGQ